MSVFFAGIRPCLVQWFGTLRWPVLPAERVHTKKLHVSLSKSQATVKSLHLFMLHFTMQIVLKPLHSDKQKHSVVIKWYWIHPFWKIFYFSYKTARHSNGIIYICLKRLTIGEYIKRFFLKRQTDRRSVRNTKSQALYKLAREGVNKEKYRVFYLGWSQANIYLNADSIK